MSSDWYRDWVSELRQDGTLTRLATQGDAGLLRQAIKVLEFLDGRPAGGWPVMRGRVLGWRVLGRSPCLHWPRRSPGTGLVRGG